MQAFVSGKKRVVLNHNMCFSKDNLDVSTELLSENYRDDPLIPGLSDDVAKLCLALVPRSSFPSMGRVCKKWRYVVKSKEFITVRRLAGMPEEWLYVLTTKAGGKDSHWEVLDCQGHKLSSLPPMPGPAKTGFKVVVVDGKLLVVAGCALINGSLVASSDVYQFDTCLNSWSRLEDLKEARYDFACAEVNGLVYVVGGHGVDGESLSSAEVYDPETGVWTCIESLRRPRWGCFASGFNGKLYVMGGRSNFTIGNSKLVDVYNPQCGSWSGSKNGLTMVTAHVEVGKKLFCIDWKNQRKMSVFNAEDETWEVVALPLSGSSRAGFQFGKLSGKLLLFSSQGETGHSTLLYDPDAAPGKQWKTSEIKLSGPCVCSVTITA
ncbi:F-box/kelch-repeat protein [Raphanus sativus]|uniref:F-box/kelch-repeat protein At1g67480 n=1 Tax=Raphanus sativus TaxID=3726 RepID=A0A9W3D290_RAPSA|nr:F-box/kelch-repeat protein At1g67480 [Raphanus sativus]XP_056857879.1 F-box/kelch-repeat protein At1g67480 [Raphanus sativus]XP_056857880.1 F-box/kelch-repeat protein At1g67480 [Raphanus sativus]XP_056857881.1 F-box/kelch-repeat protein At1g67480 [Raphanus sativus]XP_056857882.1 F-box/kelch-repeat protein At1g67480 [Raphanus sativus]KAJ4866184.1 F-box/kelch-repeat protein [Raphanus sativus]